MKIVSLVRAINLLNVVWIVFWNHWINSWSKRRPLFYVIVFKVPLHYLICLIILDLRSIRILIRWIGLVWQLMWVNWASWKKFTFAILQHSCWNVCVSNIFFRFRFIYTIIITLFAFLYSYIARAIRTWFWLKIWW